MEGSNHEEEEENDEQDEHEEQEVDEQRIELPNKRLIYLSSQPRHSRGAEPLRPSSQQTSMVDTASCCGISAVLDEY